MRRSVLLPAAGCYRKLKVSRENMLGWSIERPWSWPGPPPGSGAELGTGWSYAKIDGMATDRTPRTASLELRLTRQRNRAINLLGSAHTAMQKGQWSHSEDLLWGSLVSASRGVALWRGESVDDDAALRKFVQRLGEAEKDRYIRDAFDHLSAFAEAAERVRDRRSRVDYLFLAMDDLAEAIERLVARIPGGDGPVPDADPDDAVVDLGE